MREPRVAIITPTYNHAPFVRACIESALRQTVSSWEMAVIDDGSIDGTRTILDEFDDPRVRIIHRQHGGLETLAEAYSDALEATSAPLLAILEGDDAWPPDKLERQVPDFDNSAVVLSYGATALLDRHGCQYGVAGPHDSTSVLENRPVGSIIPSLAATNFIPAVTAMVRRTALEDIGGFLQPASIPYVDHATWLRLAEVGEFRYHADVVGCWRRHSAQYTTASVRSEPPDLAYARAALERMGMGADAIVDASRRAAERVALNRYRQALLSEGAREVAGQAARLLMTGRPRLVGASLLGLASWSLGGDLEWVLRRQRKVSWPSRRHVRRHRTRPST